MSTASRASTTEQSRRARKRLRLLATTAVALALVAGVAACGGGDDDSGAPPDASVVPPYWGSQQGYSDNAVALEGARLFVENNCMNCHTYLGSGTAANGGQDLSSIGASGMGASFFASYVGNPSSLGGSTAMPAYGEESGGPLSDDELAAVGEFLNASQGVD